MSYTASILWMLLPVAVIYISYRLILINIKDKE